MRRTDFRAPLRVDPYELLQVKINIQTIEIVKDNHFLLLFVRFGIKRSCRPVESCSAGGVFGALG